MRQEWAEAGWGRRALFVVTALYWLAMVALFVLAIPRVSSGYELGRLTGAIFSPLVLALVIRAIYAAIPRREGRRRFWSWWILVIGAAFGIVLMIQRSAAQVAS